MAQGLLIRPTMWAVYEHGSITSPPTLGMQEDSAHEATNLLGSRLPVAQAPSADQAAYSPGPPGSVGPITSPATLGMQENSAHEAATILACLPWHLQQFR